MIDIGFEMFLIIEGAGQRQVIGALGTQEIRADFQIKQFPSWSAASALRLLPYAGERP